MKKVGAVQAIRSHIVVVNNLVTHPRQAPYQHAIVRHSGPKPILRSRGRTRHCR